MKKISAYEIALSAMSCAFATLALTLGTLYSVLLFTGYLVACLALMIPLSRQSYLGDLLSYLGASLLSLLFTGGRIFDLLPFIVFFGLHPLANALQIKFKLRRWVAWAIKAVWFDVSMYLVWRFVFDMTTSFELIDRFILPVILVGGTLFFLMYDYMIFKSQLAVNRLVDRIIKKK